MCMYVHQTKISLIITYRSINMRKGFLHGRMPVSICVFMAICVILKEIY